MTAITTCNICKKINTKTDNVLYEFTIPISLSLFVNNSQSLYLNVRKRNNKIGQIIRWRVEKTQPRVEKRKRKIRNKKRRNDKS